MTGSQTRALQPHERLIERREKTRASRGANGFGPPVISPALRSEVIRLRVASVMPMKSSVNARPFGAMTAAPAFTQRLAERNVRRDDHIAAHGTFRDPVVRLIHAGADDDPLDHRIARHRDRAVTDDEDFQRRDP